MFGKRKSEELTQSHLAESHLGTPGDRHSSPAADDSGRAVEAMAIIATSMHRAVGVTLTDVQVAIALAMCDQLHRVHPRRATKSITVLNRTLATRRDRSLTAALPAIYVSSFLGQDVCVMVTQEAHAREDAELYRAILAEFDTSTQVVANDEGRSPRAPTGAGHATITVATPEVLLRSPGRSGVVIARLTPEATKRVGRGLSGAATLPDL